MQSSLGCFWKPASDTTCFLLKCITYKFVFNYIKSYYSCPWSWKKAQLQVGAPHLGTSGIAKSNQIKDGILFFFPLLCGIDNGIKYFLWYQQWLWNTGIMTTFGLSLLLKNAVNWTNSEAYEWAHLCSINKLPIPPLTKSNQRELKTTHRICLGFLRY